MKASFLLKTTPFLLLFLSKTAFSQTFNGQGNLPIPPGAPVQTVGITESIASVSGIGILGGCVQIANVTMNATHTFTGDVCIFLKGPSGQVLDLTTNNGGGGDNWTNTVFKDNAVLFPPQGAPPYNGMFRPEGRQTTLLPVPATNIPPLGTNTFASTYNGTNADGDWTLHINDHVAIDVGLLISWSITFTTNGAPPTVNAGPDVSICSGQNSVLFATSVPAGATFSWSTGQNGPSITVSPAATTTYTVTATTGGSCTATDQVTVTVNPSIAVDAGPDQSICGGQTANLSASGPVGATYSWSNGQSGQSITVSPAATQTFTVTASQGGCSATDQVQITVSPAATATLSVSNNSICEGQSINLLVNVGFGAGPFNLTINSTTGPSIVLLGANSVGGSIPISVSPTATTTFSLVSISNASGCPMNVVAPSSATITVNPLPTNPAILGNLDICRGQSTVLTASGGLFYSWSSGQNTASINVSPTATTIFTVTVSNGGAACTAVASEQVNVTTLSLAIQPSPFPAVICQGQSIVLDAVGPSGSATFVWSTGENTPSITVSPLATTSFSVTATDGPCTKNASITVIVESSGAASAGPDRSVCEGFSTTLTASGGASYAWSSGQTGATISVAPTSNTIYEVTVTSSAGCTATDQAEVTVNPAPTVDLGPDVSVCAGGSTVLTAVGTGNFVWSTGQTGPSITVAPLVPTNFGVTLTDAKGCTAVDFIFVDVGALVASAGSPQSICSGETATLTASGGTAFLWSTGATTASISVLPTVTTTFSVTVSQGICSDVASVTVSVAAVPTASAGTDKTICFGQSATLTASGGAFFQWSNGQNTPMISVAPTATTTFSVTVSNAAGCSATDDAQVIVNPQPTVSAGADQAICTGQNAILTAVGTGSFSWSNGQNGPLITVSPVISTVFTVTLTDSNGCTATDATAISVGSVTASAGANQTICLGESAFLIASGGSNYIWSTGETTQSISPQPNSTTTFSVTVSNGNCSDAASIQVAVLPAPAASAGVNKTICLGESAALTASGGTTFLWSNGQTTATISVAPTATTNFSVTVSNGSCTDFDEVQVAVNTPPALAASPDQSICAGENVNLEAFGNGVFLWSNGSSGPAITVAPTVATTFFVTLTDVAGCTAFESVQVAVAAIPNASAGPDVQLCEGATATLAASGGSSFLWSNGQTTSTISVSPLATTTFSVTVSQNGCSATDAATVTLQAAPTASIAPVFSEICSGQTAVLTASGSGSFLWSTGQFGPSITVSPTATATYDLTVTNNFGCQNFAAATVNVLSTPAAAAGPDQTICVGQSAVLTASGGSNFVWSNGQTTASITVQPTVATTFSVTVSNGNCSSTDAATVFVNPLPTANTGPNQAILTGETAILNASGGGNYAWSNGQTGATISVSPTVTTTFSLTVTDASGCTSSDAMTVFVDEPVQADLGPDQTICVGENATLVAVGAVPSGASIAWSSGQTTPSIIVSPAATTAFSVTITGSGGQKSSDEMTVFVNQKPIAPASIFGPVSVCKSSDGTFSVDPVAGATSYFWQVPTGATIVSGQNTTSISVDFGTPAFSGSVSVVAKNACGQSPASAFSVTVNEPPAQPGPLAGSLSPCASTAILYQIPPVAAGTSLFWTVSGGAFIASGQGSPSVAVDWNGSAGGQICASAENGCGLSPTLCATVATTAAPVADAGPDGSICFANGQLFQLAAAANGSSSGLWTGAPELTFSDKNSPVSTVFSSKSGVFDLIWRVTANGCEDVDSVKITFSQPPSIASVVEKCNGSASAFSVEIALAGGSSPYFLNGQAVGQPFVSTDFLSGSSYAFSFTDALGCAAPEIAGAKTCNCATAVGPLDLTPISVCAGDDFAVLYIGGENLDADDVLAFVLFENALPTGPILAVSATPQFAWQAAFEGKSLFVAAVVGTNGGAGQPILTDGCTDISQPVAVIFRPLPTVNLSPASLVLCAGECDSVLFNFSGNAPFDVIFSENGFQNEVKNLSASHFEKICPTASTTFSLVSVSDAFCENAASGSFSATVNPPVAASVAASDEVCNTTASGFSTVRDFKNYILNGDATGAWTDLDGSGATGVLPVLDFENVATGVYRFEYQTAAAIAPCPQKSFLLEVKVTATCTCPPISTVAGGPICNDLVGGFDLAVLVGAGSAAGVWSILSQPFGSNAALGGSIFPSQNAVAGVYQLVFSLAVQPPGICQKTDTTALTISKARSAGQAFSSPLALCRDQIGGPIDLFSLLQNEDAGGKWTEKSTILSQNGAFSAQNGLFDPKSQAAGNYLFAYDFAAAGGCAASTATVEIKLNDLPTASAGPDQTIDCLQPTVEIGAANAQPNLIFEWKNAAGQIISTVQKAMASDAGFYFLKVNNAAGCEARDTVEITSDGSKSVAAIAEDWPILTCEHEIVMLDAAFSQPAGLVFEWFLNQNPFAATSEIAATEAGFYKLVATNPANGCSDEALFELKKDMAAPVLTILPVENLTCTAQKVVVAASVLGSVNDFSFVWTGPSIVAGSNAAAATVAAAGDYAVVATNLATGCSASATTTVAAVGQVAFPFKILTKNPTCAGDCNGWVRLADASIGGLEAAFAGGAFSTAISFEKLCSGLFSISIRDANGCVWDSTTVLAEPLPIAVALGPDAFLELGDSLEVVASATATAIKLVWSPSDLTCFDDTFCAAFWARPFETQLFKITAFDANGCSASDDILMHVDRSVDVYAPNVFDPKSLENGRFRLFFGPGVAKIEAFEVFDRWGEKVFEQLDFRPEEAVGGWDGRFRDRDFGPDVLVWRCAFRLVDGRKKELKGDVTVVR